MKIDEGVNGKIHAKVRQMLNSKASQHLHFLVPNPYADEFCQKSQYCKC